jgi:hypothetical protein
VGQAEVRHLVHVRVHVHLEAVLRIRVYHNYTFCQI